MLLCVVDTFYGLPQLVLLMLLVMLERLLHYLGHVRRSLGFNMQIRLVVRGLSSLTFLRSG